VSVAGILHHSLHRQASIHRRHGSVDVTWDGLYAAHPRDVERAGRVANLDLRVAGPMPDPRLPRQAHDQAHRLRRRKASTYLGVGLPTATATSSTSPSARTEITAPRIDRDDFQNPLVNRPAVTMGIIAEPAHRQSEAMETLRGQNVGRTAARPGVPSTQGAGLNHCRRLVGPGPACTYMWSRRRARAGRRLWPRRSAESPQARSAPGCGSAWSGPATCSPELATRHAAPVAFNSPSEYSTKTISTTRCGGNG
jgi:hypothetical protein